MKKQIAPARSERRTGVFLRALTTSSGRPKAETSERSKASVLIPPGRWDEVDGIDDVVHRRRSRPKPDGRADDRRRRSRRTRTLLSFQGPVPGRAGNEKASARARGLRIDGLRKTSYPNRTKALLESQDFPCLPLGRPKECSNKAPEGCQDGRGEPREAPLAGLQERPVAAAHAGGRAP